MALVSNLTTWSSEIKRVIFPFFMVCLCFITSYAFVRTFHQHLLEAAIAHLQLVLDKKTAECVHCTYMYVKMTTT